MPYVFVSMMRGGSTSFPTSILPPFVEIPLVQQQFRSGTDLVPEPACFFPQLLSPVIASAAKSNLQTVDEYIATYPDEVHDTSKQMRKTTKKAVPEAEEVRYYGMLIYSAYKEHYSLSFPPPFTVFDAFKEQLSAYELSKSAIQLPMKDPFPFQLLSDMAKFRAADTNLPIKVRISC